MQSSAQNNVTRWSNEWSKKSSKWLIVTGEYILHYSEHGKEPQARKLTLFSSTMYNKDTGEVKPPNFEADCDPVTLCGTCLHSLKKTLVYFY